MQKTNSYSIWLHPPDALNLEPYQVDIWRAYLNISIGRLNELEATLSTDETLRATSFRFPADRNRFIAAHGCLRDVLSRYLHYKPDQLNFCANQYGKPALHDHELEFNLSHSGDLGLIAITRERKVGVDVERLRQGVSSQHIAEQYFSRAEVAEFQALPLSQRGVAFFTCWTLKEAYIKAQGLGLSWPLESFDVSLTPNKRPRLRATRPDSQEAARWTLLSLEIDPAYESAVAVEGQDLEFRLWDLNTR